MKYLSSFFSIFLIFFACTTTGQKITITNLTSLSPINKYIQDSIVGKPEPVTIETNDNKMETFSTWKDGLQATIIVNFMGDKTVYTFNNGVELIMKPNLDTGLVECKFNNGETFTIKNN
ncbi:MAG: hypothetical protein GY707_11040 [Desulfobacteraceae bacterium]|nr:hypothetical protein [Desulfobacteraceae bacterium]